MCSIQIFVLVQFNVIVVVIVVVAAVHRIVVALQNIAAIASCTVYQNYLVLYVTATASVTHG